MGEKDIAMFKREVTEVLTEAADVALNSRDVDAMDMIVKAAAAWQLEMSIFSAKAQDLATRLIGSACRAKLQPLERVGEVLGMSSSTAGSVGSDLDKSLGPDMTNLIAAKVFAQVERNVAYPDHARTTASVTSAVQLRKKLSTPKGKAIVAFDREFWSTFQRWYQAEANSNAKGLSVEWAIASLIAENHFDMAFACKTGMLGAGLYFAESSTKSDEYVKGNAKNQFPIIFARVTLGRINYCDKPDPSKDPGREKLQDSCLHGSYHSVLGDRIKVRKTYREYVVYDHFQVYPQFVVWYTRR